MYILEAVYNRNNKDVTDLNTKGLHQHGKYIELYMYILFL